MCQYNKLMHINALIILMCVDCTLIHSVADLGGSRGAKEPPFASLVKDFGKVLDQKEAWWSYIRGTVCAPNYTLESPFHES